MRPYCTADREGVRSLLLGTFASSSVFDRFSEGNPLGAFLAIVAEHDGKIVGFNMWNPWLLQTPVSPSVVYQSGASAVHESMRGRGLFGRLLRAGEEEARLRGIGVFLGYPNPASLPGFLKVGWRHILSLRLWMSPVPSLSVRPAASPQSSGPPPSELTARFLAWRYARAGVSCTDVRIGGSAAVLYFRTEHIRGVRVHRLLDVVGASGRPSRLGPSVAAGLPGPAVTMIRAHPAPSTFPGWLHVRRKWDTPLVVKRITAGTGPSDDELGRSTFWYGDIDAS